MLNIYYPSTLARNHYILCDKAAPISSTRVNRCQENLMNEHLTVPIALSRVGGDCVRIKEYRISCFADFINNV